MPEERRSIFSKASRVKARRPHWLSPMFDPVKIFSRNVIAGVPITRWLHVIAPGSILSMRLPTVMS